MPQISSANAEMHTAVDICLAIRNLFPASPLSPIGDSQIAAIKQLSHFSFCPPIQFPLFPAVIFDGAGSAGTTTNTCCTPCMTESPAAPTVLSLEPLPIPVAPPRVIPDNSPQLIPIGHGMPHVSLPPLRAPYQRSPINVRPSLSLNQTTKTLYSTVIISAPSRDPTLLQD